MYFKCSNNLKQIDRDMIENRLMLYGSKRNKVFFKYVFPILLIMFYLGLFSVADMIELLKELWFVLFSIIFFVVYFIVGFLKHKNSLNRILENEVSFLEITDDGFWFGYKGKIKNFIDYNLIDKVYYKSRFFEAGLQEGLKVSTRSYGLFRFFGTTFHPYIGIEFKDDNGFKQKIRLYFHIHNLYKAVDIIIAKISKDKLENIRFDNSGEMSLILGNKSIIPGVNLDKLSGKIILIILTILVLGFWIFMVLFLVD